MGENENERRPRPEKRVTSCSWEVKQVAGLISSTSTSGIGGRRGIYGYEPELYILKHGCTMLITADSHLLQFHLFG